MVDPINGSGPRELSPLRAAPLPVFGNPGGISRGRTGESVTGPERPFAQQPVQDGDSFGGLLARAVDELEQNSGRLKSRIRFSINKDRGKLIVQVVDQRTDKVIKQIPSEALLKLDGAAGGARGAIVDAAG